MVSSSHGKGRSGPIMMEETHYSLEGKEADTVKDSAKNLRIKSEVDS